MTRLASSDRWCLEDGRYDMRAGDYPFVAIARRDQLPLITEDNQQFAAAQTVGVQVFGSLTTY